MGVKDLFKRISSIMPVVAEPKKKLDLKVKLLWTAIAAIIYLVMSEIPLYGVYTGKADPFQYSRIIFASKRGTLMELGIGPIVTAGLVLQLLSGAEIIKFDFTNTEDRALFTAMTKVLTILLTIAQTAAYLVSGIFGTSLTVTTTAAIFIQLVLGTIVVMMLDELVQKGWGIGSGISLFIALGVAQGIFWSLFSPFPISENGVPVPYGAIPYLFHILFTGENLSKAFFRPSIGPTMIGLIMTIIVAAVIIYAEGIRIELPISYARHRGYRGRYPVKLLYVSNIPVILAFALSSTFYMISQLIWARYNADNSNWLLNLLGSYNITSHSPIGGLAYYLTPPGSLNQAMEEPIRSLFFILIMIILTVVFAKIWVEIGGLSAERVSQQLIDAGMQIPGFRRREYSISTVLGRYIPVVTVIGGFFVGLIAGTAQILGVFGSGMGILLTIDILTNYYQLLMKERVEEMYPAISKVLKV